MSTGFENLIMRDTRANQPAAGVPGRLYYVTDEGVTERDNGSTWDDVSDQGASGVARSGSTTDGNLAVWNGANADSIRDGGKPARVLISEQTPTATGTCTFDSIPGTYKSLELEIVGRTDKAAAATGMNLYFNADTTDANYARRSTTATSTSVSTGRADTADCLSLTAGNATAGEPGVCRISILGYAGTTFRKIADVINLTRTTTTGEIQNWQTLFWENTSAITRIDIVVDDSSNYVTGTTFRLYGVN